MTKMIFTVAIDGPAAAGKGTISRAIAAQFGFAHLDTGLLYRAVGARVLAGEDAAQAAKNLRAEDIDRHGLRSAAVGQAASQAASLPEVRAALFYFQRSFARRPGGAILDGRDIGTIICPEAEVKLFVTAADHVRAHRRWLERVKDTPTLTEAEVLAEQQARDARDSAREIAPLAPAADAVILDTTHLGLDDAIAAALQAVATALDAPKT